MTLRTIGRWGWTPPPADWAHALSEGRDKSAEHSSHFAKTLDTVGWGVEFQAMDWSDEAIVLGMRHHGEHAAILDALTRSHGRHLGLIRGATSKRLKGALEPGNLLTVHWRGRLDQHLGTYTVELARARAAQFFADGLKLSVLAAACAIAAATLPEREKHARAFDALSHLLDTLGEEDALRGVADYVRFEAVLLEDLGFGLDLESCAVTGTRHDLTYVSPKSGRAVSTGSAAPYRDRLFALPAFLLDHTAHPEPKDLANGLTLTGFFLGRSVLEPHGIALPAARTRLTERLAAGRSAR
jgi:DNA repair protein RecO (recombination protein O)